MAQPPNNTRMNGLIDLARRDGIDIKPTLLRVLTDLYVQSPTHTADEEAQFIELACRLLAFADAETRAIVAARLRAYPRAPLAVLKVLATDAAPSHLEAMTASESESTPSPDIGQDEAAHAEFKAEAPSAVLPPQPMPTKRRWRPCSAAHRPTRTILPSSFSVPTATSGSRSCTISNLHLWSPRSCPPARA